MTDPGACPECGAGVRERALHAYPLRAQIAFGASFVAFLAYLSLSRPPSPGRAWIPWAWTALQCALGVWLVRGRLRSRARVWRCIRCGRDLG